MLLKQRSSRQITLVVALAVLLGSLVWNGSIVIASDLEPGNGEPYDVYVDNVFFDMFMADALRDVSLETGVPILADATVSGFISIDLVDVPLPIALRQMALYSGYAVRWMDGYYVIGRADPGSPLFHVLSVTERVRLNHIDASDLSSMLVPPFRDMVRVDLQTNSAIVTGSPDSVERIISDIKNFDVAPYQIRIDAVVAEVSSTGRKALGLDWGWREGSSPSTEGSSIQFVNLVGNIGYSLTGGLDRFFLNLKNQIGDGNAKIRANPNIVALEGKPASLFVGKTSYYRIVTGTESSPATRLESIEAGVSLDILARVASDGQIVLDIAPSVSDVQGHVVGDLPVIGRRKVSTTVRIRDGETFGIGGLLQETTTESMSRVPVLGNLPIIGRLFSMDRSETDESEVIILITPQIMHDEVTE